MIANRGVRLQAKYKMSFSTPNNPITRRVPGAPIKIRTNSASSRSSHVSVNLFGTTPTSDTTQPLMLEPVVLTWQELEQEQRRQQERRQEREYVPEEIQFAMDCVVKTYDYKFSQQ